MSSIFASLALLVSAAVRPSKPKVKLKAAPDRQAFEAATRGQLERRIQELEAEVSTWRQTDSSAETQAVESARRRTRLVVRDLAFPAPGGAPLAHELCNCVPSRSDMWASRRV